MNKDRPKRIIARTKRPLVLLSGVRHELVRRMDELIGAWGWDLRDAMLTPNEWPSDGPVAGALIGDLPTSPLAQRLREAKCPTVRRGRLPHPDDRSLPAVLPDFTAAGLLAAEHLVARGLHHIACVGHNPEDPDAGYHPMYVGLQQRAAELGATCHVKSLKELDETSPDKHARRTDVLVDWVRDLPKPVGVLTHDWMAVRMLIACVEAGVAVPEDLALLGYGNSVQCELAPVGISSIDPGEDVQIRTALRLLHDMMEGKPGPRAPIMVPPLGIVERRSTDMLAVPDPLVARALRFIWDHFDQNLSVQDIADAVGVPRRSLERGFRRHLDRSVHAELARKRIAELRSMLVESELPLADLAPRAGFTTLANAHKSFRQTYGTSPGKYRRQHRGR